MKKSLTIFLKLLCLLPIIGFGVLYGNTHPVEFENPSPACSQSVNHASFETLPGYQFFFTRGGSSSRKRDAFRTNNSMVVTEEEDSHTEENRKATAACKKHLDNSHHFIYLSTNASQANPSLAFQKYLAIDHSTYFPIFNKQYLLLLVFRL